MEKDESTQKNTVSSPVANVQEDKSDSATEEHGKKVPMEEHKDCNPVSDELEENACDNKIDGLKEDGLSEKHLVELSVDENMAGTSDVPEKEDLKENVQEETSSKVSDNNEMQEDAVKTLDGFGSLNSNAEVPEGGSETCLKSLDEKMGQVTEPENGGPGGTTKKLKEVLYGEDSEPVFDGTEGPGMESNRSSYTGSSDNEPEMQGYAWAEKAVAVTNFVRENSVVAVSNVLRRLSGKSIDDDNDPDAEDNNRNSKGVTNSSQESAASPTNVGYGWNPFSFIGVSREVDAESITEEEYLNELIEPIAMKGRVILYTRLGCQDCKEARLFLHKKRLRYVEINIDVYPGRKLELERIAGSSAVPRVLFNEVLIGGLDELRSLDESGKLAEKINYVVCEAASFEAPLPPLSGEDDMSSSGAFDELALVVRKMKDHIVVKDRFYKMRRFVSCFLGSEAVDFLSEDQYLEREEVRYFFISPLSDEFTYIDTDAKFLQVLVDFLAQ